MLSRLVFIFVFASLFVVAAGAVAAPPEELRDRARTFLVLRLTEALELGNETALRVSRVFEESEARRDALLVERGEVENDIREALRAGVTDETTLAPLVDRAAKIDEDLALVPARSFRELRALLTAEQQAKLVLARPKIHEEIQAAIRRRLQTPKKEHP